MWWIADREHHQVQLVGDKVDGRDEVVVVPVVDELVNMGWELKMT